MDKGQRIVQECGLRLSMHHKYTNMVCNTKAKRNQKRQFSNNFEKATLKDCPQGMHSLKEMEQGQRALMGINDMGKSNQVARVKYNRDQVLKLPKWILIDHPIMGDISLEWLIQPYFSRSMKGTHDQMVNQINV